MSRIEDALLGRVDDYQFRALNRSGFKQENSIWARLYIADFMKRLKEGKKK